MTREREREKDAQSGRNREVERGGLFFIPAALHNTHERVHARAGGYSAWECVKSLRKETPASCQLARQPDMRLYTQTYVHVECIYTDM